MNTDQTITANTTFNGNVTLNNPFVSNYVDLTLATYENQFYGDIYGYRAMVSQFGFYVKDTPGPGGNTYALIDSTGNLQAATIASSSTITAVGNISTTSNLSGANISTVVNVTANQLLIKDPANVAPSIISQTDDTFSIRAISANASPQTTLTLATRSATNVFSTMLSGNTNNLKLGADCTNIELKSPNLKIESTTISTDATSAVLNGGSLIINNTLKTFNDNVVLNESTTMNNSFTFNDGANATQLDQNGGQFNCV